MISKLAKRTAYFFVEKHVMIQFTVTRRYGMYLSLGQLTASLAMLGESVKHKMNHDRWKNGEEKVS